MSVARRDPCHDGSGPASLCTGLSRFAMSGGVLCVFVASALASFAQDTKAVRVVSAECGFSITFPAAPRTSHSRVSTTGKVFIPVTRYYFQTSESLLAVSCSPARRKGKREQLMDEARDAALQATGTRVIKEQRLGRVRLLEVEGDGVRGLVKLAVVRNHYVQVLALSHADSFSPAMYAFIDSLMLH